MQPSGAPPCPGSRPGGVRRKGATWAIVTSPSSPRQAALASHCAVAPFTSHSRLCRKARASSSSVEPVVARKSWTAAACSSVSSVVYWGSAALGGGGAGLVVTRPGCDGGGVASSMAAIGRRGLLRRWRG